MDGELPALVETVLQKQHRDLLDRLDAWLCRVETAIDTKPLGGLPDIPGLPQIDEVSPSKASKDSPSDFVDKEDVPSHAASSRSIRKTVQAHEYEIAKEEGLRFESSRKLATEDSRSPSADVSWGASVCTRCQDCCRSIAASVAFNISVAFVIVSNSVFLGAQLEWSAVGSNYDDVAFAFLVGHTLYALVFTIETSIRLVAVGPRIFFCGQDCAWNWLDVFIVVPAWIELAVDLGGSASNFRIIRVFRVTRLLQLIRSVRLIRFISAFRELVMSVIDTVRQVVWAMVLLVLMIYSFGILFTDVSLQHVDDVQVENADPQLLKYFGSLYVSCSTLFRALLEGFDWIEAADSLGSVGVLWVQLFHTYIAVGGLAILNVITGVFVNSAIKTREKDQETLLRHVQTFKQLVASLWAKIDASGTGQITISEFEEMFKEDEMQAFFEKIEVTAVDAWTLFDSLDADGDHLISYAEFSQRCMQLHGNARSVDLFALKQQTDKLRDQLQSVEEGQGQANAHLSRLARAVAMMVPEHPTAKEADLISVELKWAQ